MLQLQALSNLLVESVFVLEKTKLLAHLDKLLLILASRLLQGVNCRLECLELSFEVSDSGQGFVSLLTRVLVISLQLGEFGNFKRSFLSLRPVLLQHVVCMSPQ